MFHGCKGCFLGMLLTGAMLAFLSAVPVMAGDVAGDLILPAADETQLLTLIDGSTLVGKITQVGDSEITFETKMGEMTISIDKIVEIKMISSEAMKDGKYWFPNPNRTRLFFGQTGRMLKKGEGYFSDTYLFFPGIAFGITDNITFGGGMSIFPGLDFNRQLFYFTPKIGVSTSENMSLAVGALVVRVPVDDDLDSDDPLFVGVAYGAATLGTDDRSFSVALGYGFVEDEMADKPAVMLGCDYRLSRRTAFVSENWIFPGVDDPLVSYGIRFFGEKLSVDLGFVTV
ncbi:MAG: hypothetical protein KAT79_00535, partial [candidate division Zixibacteria bacterium]|nr:hypothetical protein [candidate division Zixibacteria bacterium]